MKNLLPSIFILFCLSTKAQTPNWAEDIAPILYQNCTQCHHNGGLSPFPLITYTDAVSVQLGMQDAVNARRMPPWPPDPAYRNFAHERLLTLAEITAINDWIALGAPSGNLSLAPPPPVYTNSSILGIPDLSLSIPSYTVGSPTDIYRCFPIPSGLTSQQYITSMEVIPGDPSIVHHVLVYADDANTCIALDSADPGPGYTNFGGPGSGSAKLIGAWVPGAEPYALPANMGIPLNANTNIIIQVHYPAGSLGMTDTTRINFKLSSGPMRDVTILAILNHSFTMVNGPLYIPPNQIKTFHEQFTLSAALDFSVLSLGPHMHLIGKSIISYGVTPINDTIPLIKINNWNFRWHGNYSFKKIQKVPGGTTLHAFATYDNTSNNLFNPNSPPQAVSAGESTTDEMMLVYFFFLPYLPGDENINLDSTFVSGDNEHVIGNQSVTPDLYDIFPNPVQENIHFGFYLPASNEVTVHLTDLNGKLIAILKNKQFCQAGMHTMDFNIKSLAIGKYLITLYSNGYSKSKSFIKE